MFCVDENGMKPHTVSGLYGKRARPVKLLLLLLPSFFFLPPFLLLSSSAFFILEVFHKFSFLLHSDPALLHDLDNQCVLARGPCRPAFSPEILASFVSASCVVFQLFTYPSLSVN